MSASASTARGYVTGTCSTASPRRSPSWRRRPSEDSDIRAFRAAHPDGPGARVSQGLVVIPTDSATAAQRATYAA
ncbi:MAG TPA: hypothetical protein VHO07_03745 [Streptosporangiaceae bacterium]|nr:hypothetical protein [Streptosporangiaceae bacterium]